MAFRWRNLKIGQPFARRGVGEKIYYSVKLMLDVLAERLRLGLQARMPGLDTPPDALSAIGRDRLVVRGFAEDDAAFEARLRRWLTDKATLGGPFALLAQLRAYFTPYAVRLRTVDNSGNWFSLLEDGSTSVFKVAGNWNWDGNTSQWSRFWVIIYPLATGAFGDGIDYGTANHYADGSVWGTSLSQSQCDTIRELVRAWKPAGTRCVSIILAYDDASFDPAGSGAGYPDGTWGKSYKIDGGVAVPSRLETAAYLHGTGP